MSSLVTHDNLKNPQAKNPRHLQNTQIYKEIDHKQLN